MKRYALILSATLLSACLFGMLFSGCKKAEQTEAPIAASPSPTAPSMPVKTPAPTAASVPDETPAPSPTPFALNPVYAFYDLFEEETASLLSDYTKRLSALNTAEALSYSLLLSEHRTALSEGRITVGRLYGSDAGDYSGTLSAAAPGSGSMKGSQERGYTFSYTYNNGCTLSGSFDGAAIEYTVYDGTEPKLHCRIEKAADVWTSTAADSSCMSELTVSLFPEEGEEAVTFAKRDGRHLPPALTVSSEISEEE